LSEASIYELRKAKKMEKGRIIFLNGVSSAGKTTLAKALQTKLSEPFYLLSNDIFCDMSPEKFWDIDSDETGSTALTGLHHTIKTFSDIGINSIVDHVLLKGQGEKYNITKLDNMSECVALLHDYPVLFVHVVCSDLEELRRRETERGDRGIGQGESQLAELNPQDTYDITVDTYSSTTEECADKIIEMLNYPEKFTAFKNLWEHSTK
jgi:chloramphenicol 3-O-phosphotransferase